MPPVTPIPIEDLMQQADGLYRFARSRVKDHHAAEDLVQNCLSAAWQRIDAFDGRSSLSTWLIGMMKFKAIDHFRKSKRTPTDQAIHVADEDDSRQDPIDNLFNSKGAWNMNLNRGLEMLTNSPEDSATRSELMTWVMTRLNRLPDCLRTLFILREVDGLHVPSAASAAGVTAGSAAMLLTRSRQRLRLCLQQNGIDP